MPCAPGRVSSNSRQPGQRGGSLLSRRYFDPRTHKVYPGPPALFRNTEQRRIFVTLVTLEIDPWKFLAPLPLLSQGSEAHVTDGSLESSSSQPSEILVDSIPEADRPVNCVSRKKRKKKGKHHKKSVAKTVSTVLATQCEERDIPQTEESDMPEDFSLVSNRRAIDSSSPESHEIVQAGCDVILSGSSSSSSLDKDTFCSTSETSYDKDGAECITCCSSTHMWQKDSCDTLCNTERAGNSCQASSSDGFQPVINRKRNWLNKRASQNLNGIHRFGRHNMLDMIGKDRVLKNEGRDRLNTSNGSNKHGRNCSDLSPTAKLTASRNYSDSIEVRPKGTCREYKVPEMLNRKQYSDALQGNNTAPNVSHTGMGTSSQWTQLQCTSTGIGSPSGSNFLNGVAIPTENAVSCQSGLCETQIIVEEDITSEGAHSTATDTSEVTPSTVTDTSEGTHSTATDTSEVTPSTVTDTSEVAPSTVTDISEGPLSIVTATKDVLQDLCLASLPAEKKDSLAIDISGTGSLGAAVDESISSSHDISAASDSSLMHEVKDQCFSGFDTDLGKIVQVVEDSYRLQTISEGVRLVTGSPVAEFEKFVLSATPVLDKLTCRTCSPDQFIGDSFCEHQFPNIPLRSLWQWYDKLGSYGMEVKAMDYNSHKSRNGGFGFRAYFVPYLSAIQLFGRCKSSASSNSCSNKEAREGGVSDEGSNQWSRSPHQDDGELLFEYFESDLPHQRRPLLEKIKQLIRGDTSANSKPFGDPLKLECLNLHDLHPASWYSVAWYPIYRIPDGNFRATFLTYYSLGNFVRVTPERPGSSVRLVSPVVGLQTYNAKGESWFRPTVSKTKECETDPSEIMEGRIRMLEQAALVMARATVCKGNEKSVNRHPDFEFFLTRRW